LNVFEIVKSAEFAAAHALRDYDGPCARNHGHNYKVEIVIRGERLDGQEMLIDFAHLDRVVAPLIERVDHRNLNDMPPFDRVNPTAEAVAAWFYREMRPRIAEVSGGRAALSAVRLWETPDSCVTYTEES
jgi:6-pyruvoyltetrahydropterin/6-carboxytetrahydropterin synthase